MNKFVVMVFANEAKAYKGLHALWDLHSEGTVTVFGAAVIGREPNGTLVVRQANDEGPLGFGVGTLVGGLLGVFGGPAGVALGALSGGVLGGVRDIFHAAVSDEFLDDVERDLTPGKFAVVAEVSEEWLVPLEERVRELEGTVIRESRTDYVDALVEQSVDARKAELEQWKAARKTEMAQWSTNRNSEKAKRMETNLETKVQQAEDKLRRTAENARTQLHRTKDEMNAKLLKLQEQAAKASPDVRDRIQARINSIRSDFEQREKKLTRAYEITQEALHA
jgi:uncharacterized membrane protein